MVLILHIRFSNMRFCAFILMSSLPIAWIAAGCVLLLLVVVMSVLFFLKSREVNTLKKQCEDLRETMRMMRYEEANLARMLHTASKPVEQPEELGVAAEEEADVPQEEQQADAQKAAPEETILAEPLDCPDDTETLEISEVSEPSESSDSSDSSDSSEISDIRESLEGFENQGLQETFEVEEPQVATPHKQPINERRPAIPVDLFSAWFAENESALDDSSYVNAEQNDSFDALPAEPIATPNASVELEASSSDLVVEQISVVEGEAPIAEDAVAMAAEEISNVELSKEDERFYRKLERIVNTRLRNPNLNIDIIAAQFGIGRTNFYRKVREVTGMSPNDYLRKCRMERAAELLKDSEVAVNDVCAQVGIPDAQYFSRVFKTYYGISPSIYRDNNNQ